MSKKFINRKKKYLKDLGYCDKVYVDKSEDTYITRLKRKDRERYLKENKVFYDDYSSEDTYYYRIVDWSINDDEFKNIIMMDENLRLRSIEQKLSTILFIVLASIVLKVIFVFLGMYTM